MKKSKFLSIISILIVFTILFSGMPAFARDLTSTLPSGTPAAIPTDDTISGQALPAETDPVTDNLRIETLPKDLIENANLDMSNVIGLDTADAANMYSLTTINNQGTRALQIFAGPIKFKDEKSGKIKFIDNTMKISDKKNKNGKKYAFENTENSVKVYLPQVISDGVQITKDNYSLDFTPLLDELPTNPQADENSQLQEPVINETMSAENIVSETQAAESTVETQAGAPSQNKIKKPIPVPATNVEQKSYKFAGNKEKVANYKDSYGKGYSFQYAPTNTGVKENMYIEQYDGVNSVSFIVNANGLVPKVSDDRITVDFSDVNTGEVIFTVSPTYIQDSYTGEDENHKGITYENTYAITDNGDGTYTITTTLDESFLSDPNTVYPILVDPTIGYSNVADMISDCYLMRSLSSNAYTVNTTDTVLFAGTNSYFETMWYVKTSFIKYIKFINPQNITSAYYNVIPSYGSSNVTLMVFDSKTTCDINSLSGISWPNLLGSGSMQQTFVYDPSDLTYISINIYDTIKQAFSYSLGQGGTQDDGFFIQQYLNTSWVRTFYSTRSAYSPNYPCIQINYNESTNLSDGIYFIKSVGSGKYLDHNQSNNSVNQWGFNGGKNQAWQVILNGDGSYFICALDNINLVLDVSGGIDANGTPVTAYGYNGNGNQKWRIIQNKDGTYRIMSQISCVRGLNIYYGGDPAKYGLAAQIYEFNNGGNEKWIFEKYKAARLTYTNDADGANRGWYVDQSESVVSGMGYYLGITASTSSNEAISDLSAASGYAIYTIHTHGSKTTVKYTDAKGNVTNMTITDLNNLPQNSLRYKRLVIYGTCSAGEGGAGANNMVTATYNKGAETVIGFQGVTLVAQINTWFYEFFKAAQTQNIYDAVNTAKSAVRGAYNGDYGGTDNILIMGSTSQCLAN